MHYLTGRLIPARPLHTDGKVDHLKSSLARALLEAGIPVSSLDQGPGELIICLEEAYYFTFNHGFALATALSNVGEQRKDWH